MMSQEAWDSRQGPAPAAAPRPGRSRPQILVGIRDLAFHQEVLDFLERDPRFEVAGATTDPRAVLGLIEDGTPGVAVVCPMLLAELTHPAAGGRLPPLLVVAEEITVPVLREAIDASVRAVFAWPNERDELAETIARSTTEEGRGTRARGVVLAVFGARGGAGTTFVASHLAATFADRSLATALVDLDVDFGGLTVALGIEADAGLRTVADLVPVASELGPDHLEDALYRHQRGFAALLAPPEEFANPIPAGLYRDSVALLAGTFQVVLLHVPRGLDEVVRAGVEMADHVLLVTTQDLFSLYGARRAMAALKLERPGRCKVVVNRMARAEVTAADISRILGIRPSATVRFDPAVARVQNRGQLLSPRSRRAGRDVRGLAGTIANSPATARPEGARQ